MGVNGIYGLSGSGLDVESMVKVGMLSKQSEYDKMQQKYTQNEWKKSDYVDVYNEIQTFNNSTLSQYKMSNNMNAHSATSANTSVVTATANASAPAMTHYVEVDQLASAAYLVGTKLERANEDESTKNQLQNILFEKMEFSGTNQITVTYAGGDTDTFDADATAISFSLNDGVKGLMTSENEKAVTAYAGPDAATGTHKVEIVSLATAPDTQIGENIDELTKDTSMAEFFNWSFSFDDDELAEYATNASKAISFTFGDGKKDGVKINYTFKDLFDTDTTVTDFIKNLNDKFKSEGLNLEVGYIANDSGDGGSFALSNSNVGTESKIKFSIDNIAGIDDDIIENLGKNLFGNRDIDEEGNNAVGKFGDSDDEVIFDNGNTTTVDGITYTAKAVTEGKIEVTNDDTKTVDFSYRQLLEGATFNDLTSKINGFSMNVRATYDSVQDKFSFYNKQSGEDNTITFDITSDTSAGSHTVAFFEALGLKQTSSGSLAAEDLIFETGKSTTVKGVNASVKVDGVEYNDLSSNKTTINGVVYTFQNVTENSKVAVTVSQDTEAIIGKVKSFVEDYNKLLSKLYEWYDEKPNSDYKPLTERQKEGMKDEQIEKWEEKAKAGLLYHDRTLGNVIMNIRSAVSEKVEGIEGKYNNIFALGISTTGSKGQLTIDEDKLNAALAEDPEAVYNIFAKLDGGETQYLVTVNGKNIWTTNKSLGTPVLNSNGEPMTKSVERSSYNGVAQRLSDVFMNGMKSIKAVSGTTSEITEDSELNNLLRELQTKMSNFRKTMQAFETALYKKYDAMESSLALLGAQLNYVTGAFSQ